MIFALKRETARVIVPPPGIRLSRSLMRVFARRYCGLTRRRDKWRLSPPTFLAIDILLSLSTTSNGSREVPALLSASYAMPPVSAPSPMTATTWYFWFLIVRACAMPSATETESEACPVMHGSVMLSSGFIKPHRPPYCRSVSKRSRRPVRILWT